ncbi:alpha/beta hydrolase [Actinoplanes sp. NPDC051475]|uniref:alpha/beta hydrolase n=1 Tax=Actinoplanes sp. NPDC051475 TaxID=3157225 RepID=UPI00344FA2B5
MTEIRTEEVTFTADGLTLAGTLRGDAAEAVVLTGPFTGVKDQVVGRYAEELARRGFTTLAFDHRGFGASDGRRAHEDSQGKLADLRAAVSLLDRDRVAVVGVCLGAGYAVRAAAADPRVRAVAGIAGAYNSPAWFARDPIAYRHALRGFVEAYDDYLPAVAPENGPAAMGGDEPWAYYGTARGHADRWENRVTTGSLHSLMTFDALGAAPLLTETPLLVVHGRKDDYCSPELAEAMYAAAPGEKEIEWLDAREHIDFYDVPPIVTRAAEVTADFLHRHLRDAPRTAPPAAG